MRYLEKICRNIGVLFNQPLLHFLLNVSRQQESHAAVFEPQYKRIVIRRLVNRRRVGRPQHVASHSVPIEFAAAHFVYHTYAMIARFLEQVFECVRLLVAPNPQLSDAEILHYAVQSIEMIVMRMREGDHIKALDSPRPKIRRHHLLAHVEP